MAKMKFSSDNYLTFRDQKENSKQGNQANNAGGEDSNGGNVAGSNASEITAMVYVMNEQTDTKLPDTYYLQIIKDGYTHFGFDKSVLTRALKEALKEAR